MAKKAKAKPAPRVVFEEIPIEHLMLDDENPRFATPTPQSDLFARFAANLKTQRLAAHIVANGLDPLKSLGVTKEAPDRFIVREGNRRTAALRLLHDPQLAGLERLTK